MLLGEEGRVVYGKRVANDLGYLLRELGPYRARLEGVVVESTFNGYWLVDGLMEAGYRVHLANTAAFSSTRGSSTPTIAAIPVVRAYAAAGAVTRGVHLSHMHLELLDVVALGIEGVQGLGVADPGPGHNPEPGRPGSSTR